MRMNCTAEILSQKKAVQTKKVWTAEMTADVIFKCRTFATVNIADFLKMSNYSKRHKEFGRIDMSIIENPYPFLPM